MEHVDKNEEKHENTDDVKEWVSDVFEAQNVVDRVHETTLNGKRRGKNRSVWEEVVHEIEENWFVFLFWFIVFLVVANGDDCIPKNDNNYNYSQSDGVSRTNVEVDVKYLCYWRRVVKSVTQQSSQRLIHPREVKQHEPVTET